MAVVVRDLEEAIRVYTGAFGLALLHREDIPGQHVRVAFLGDPAGGEHAAQVELLEPAGAEGAAAKFLAARGPGVHHLAFRADDLSGEMERLRREGRPPLEARPRPGAHGHAVCFLHPKHACGVLVELVGEGERHEADQR